MEQESRKVKLNIFKLPDMFCPVFCFFKKVVDKKLYSYYTTQGVKKKTLHFETPVMERVMI